MITKSRFKGFHPKLILLLIVLVLLQCCKKTSSSKPIVLEQKNDSIFSWIKEGRKRNLNKRSRSVFLKKAYDQAKTSDDDSLKTKYFSRLSLAYLRLGDSLSFRMTNNETRRLAKITDDFNSKAESHWDLAEYFRSKSIADSSYYHFNEANKIYTEKDCTYLKGRMLYNMALVQADIKDYAGSEITTFIAIQHLKPLDKNKELYRCYNNLGSVTTELEEFDDALLFYLTAENYLSKIKDNNNLKQVIENNIGIVYQETGDNLKAISYFEKVLSHDSINLSKPKLYAKTLNNYAYSKFKLNDTLELPKLFEDAISIQKEIPDYSALSRTYYNVADYYSYRNDTLKALAFAEKAVKIASQSSNNKRLLLTYKLLASLDSKNVRKHYQNYIKLDDSLSKEERKIRNKFERIRFETNEFIAKNQSLAKQRQLLTSIVIILFLLGLAAIIIFLQRVKNQKLRFQQQQQESNQEIFDLMLTQKKKVEEGKQSEQKRISEELHDSVVGQMHSVRMLLLGLNKKADETAITLRQDAIEKLKEVQEEVRTISHELNDAAYQKIYNFISSIEDLLKGFENTEGILTNLEYDDDTDWDQLSGEVKINLYRVIQESLQNCAKHANAKNVSLSLNTNSEGIIATLADDGVGFDVRKGKKGIGLKNIQSRVEKINGTWGVTSQSGKGTTVQIQVPSIDIRKVEDINLESEQQEA